MLFVLFFMYYSADGDILGGDLIPVDRLIYPKEVEEIPLEIPVKAVKTSVALFCSSDTSPVWLSHYNVEDRHGEESASN